MSTDIYGNTFPHMEACPIRRTRTGRGGTVKWHGLSTDFNTDLTSTYLKAHPLDTSMVIVGWEAEPQYIAGRTVPSGWVNAVAMPLDVITTVQYASIYDPDVKIWNWSVGEEVLDGGSYTIITSGINIMGSGTAITTGIAENAYEVQYTKVIGTTDITVTFSATGAVSASGLQADAGKVNDTTWNGYTSGSVLFVGVDVSQIYDPETNTATNQYVYKFRARAADWNKVWRADIQDWWTPPNVMYGSLTFATYFGF